VVHGGCSSVYVLTLIFAVSHYLVFTLSKCISTHHLSIFVHIYHTYQIIDQFPLVLPIAWRLSSLRAVYVSEKGMNVPMNEAYSPNAINEH
jgi:hypothetical protein